MQIHVRVWRGIYKPKSLRWNIRYNAKAGVEILELYLRRFALNRSASSRRLDEELLSRAVYAMYTSGPDAFHPFLKRAESGKSTLSDRLFREKLAWVKQREFDQLSLCLFGTEL